MTLDYERPEEPIPDPEQCRYDRWGRAVWLPECAGGYAEVKARDYWGRFVASVARPLLTDPWNEDRDRMGLEFAWDSYLRGLGLEGFVRTRPVVAFKGYLYWYYEPAPGEGYRESEEDPNTPYDGVEGYTALPLLFWGCRVEELDPESGRYRFRDEVFCYARNPEGGL